ncbi:MAG: hypothetical protein JW800_05440 [Candidatus Omnitrophica bacterium]|nr:hypothetical protein [Candidatus Omnitrophota bacterium]
MTKDKYDIDDTTRQELIKKYRFAGRIRFISFTILFGFLMLMKFIGGYSYLNEVFLILIFVEAVLNQPYGFILKRTNLYRLQYYHMLTDIIVISWIIYYMGGIEAPLVSIAYYAVILWAGVVSTAQAVFFATTVSSFLFSVIVISEHFGILPAVSYYGYEFTTAQMLSILVGNVSFIFAFGYFSGYSSKIIKFLERKREEERLWHVHHLLAAGYLIENTAHDIINHLTGIRVYAEELFGQVPSSEKLKKALEDIEKLDDKSTDMLTRLFSFVRRKKAESKFEPTAINDVINEALGLAQPVIRYSNMAVKKVLGDYIPMIMADREQLTEVFIVFIMNSLDVLGEKEGIFSVGTHYLDKENMVEVMISDTGGGISPENIKRLGEPFFTTKEPGKGTGLGLTTAYAIIERLKGTVEVRSKLGKGTLFTIRLPAITRNESVEKI